MKKKIKGDNCCIFLMGDNFYMIINGKLILKFFFFFTLGGNSESREEFVNTCVHCDTVNCLVL